MPRLPQTKWAAAQGRPDSSLPGKAIYDKTCAACHATPPDERTPTFASALGDVDAIRAALAERDIDTATLLAALISAGCENNAKYFEPEGSYRLANQHMDAQAANGARADGTLYPRHFSGDKLSSLGQTKLAQIATASKDDTAAVEVYLDMPEAAATTARKDAVKAFRQTGCPRPRLAVRLRAVPGEAGGARAEGRRVHADRGGPARADPALHAGGRRSPA